MASLLAVDPGLRGCGVALFEGDQLRAAAYVLGTKEGKRSGAWVPMVEAVYRQFPRADVLAIELPQVYREAKLKGDPNDLIDLAAVVGGLCVLYGQSARVYLPREWKKQVPKDIMHERAIKRLSPSELAAVSLPKAKSLAHNVWDAVSLGLVHVGRL